MESYCLLTALLTPNVSFLHQAILHSLQRQLSPALESNLTLLPMNSDPQAKGGSHRPPALQTPIPSSESPGHPHFCPTWLQIGGSKGPLFGLDNML